MTTAIPPAPPAIHRPASPHPLEERADRWHAERRWAEADAEWGRVAAVDPFGAAGECVGGGKVYWTAEELCRLFGLPRVLLDALAPVDRDDAGPLYHPAPVAAALTEARRLRAA